MSTDSNRSPADLTVILTLINKINTIMMEQPTVDGFLSMVIPSICSDLALSEVKLYCFQANTTQITLVTSEGMKLLSPSQTQPLLQASPLTQLLQTHQPLVLAAPHQWPNFCLSSTIIQAWLPLLSGGQKFIGVLDLQTNQPEAFPAETLPYYTILANHLATTLNNLASTDDDSTATPPTPTDKTPQTADDLAHLIQREQITRQISAQLRQATSLEELVQLAAEALGEQLAADQVVVTIEQPANQRGWV